MKKPVRSQKTGPKKAPKEHNRIKTPKDQPRKKAPQKMKTSGFQESKGGQESGTTPSGPLEKAYKLLAAQEGISNRDAKELIDRGVVYAYGKKVLIARADMKASTKFKVEYPASIETIFSDDHLCAVYKPPFIDSEEVSKQLKLPLINRLDKETSGIMLLAKTEEFRLKAIDAFRKKEVYKEYVALVDGLISEEITIDKPIKTFKGVKAKSVVAKEGMAALTVATPLSYAGGKTKLKVVIHTGRTHQIRVHLSSVDHPICGDQQYGGSNAKRMMLHSKKIELLGYTLEVDEPVELKNFG